MRGLSGNPVLEAGPQRRLRRDEARLDQWYVVVRFIEREVVGQSRAKGLAPAKQVFGHRQRAVNVLRGERLHQAAEREVGHREARRLAADEQARDSKLVEPDRDRKAGASVGEVKI